MAPHCAIQVTIDAPLPVGSASRTNNLMNMPMSGGILKSDLTFEPAIDAEFIGVGNDYIHADPDGQHLRLNAHGVIKTKDEAVNTDLLPREETELSRTTSQLLYVNYTGIVTMGPAEQAVFGGTASDGATPFGNSFTHFTFETGNARYKELENRIFVGQGRFRTEKGKPIVVEYKVGQVVRS